MEEKKNNKTSRNLGIKLVIFFLVAMALAYLILYLMAYVILPGTRTPAEEVICRSNLNQLTIIFRAYNAENHKWPTASNWCDVTKPYYHDPKFLLCPNDKIGPCSYAMNENIPADADELPPDLVLFFECAPGWNQTGGPDDVATVRHDKHRHASHILFADGHVEFVKPEDIPNLRWTVEE